jgi:hypothetical protein
MVHLDEAGIGNPKHEPWVVVAGVAVHADDQWRSLEQYLTTMADDFVPSHQRDGFVFHAKDLFHGSGVFDRAKWPKKNAGKFWTNWSPSLRNSTCP